MAEKKGIPEEVRQYLAVELGKPVVTICTGKPNALKLEVVDVECFPAERESDEPTWQLSNPEDGKPAIVEPALYRADGETAETGSAVFTDLGGSAAGLKN